MREKRMWLSHLHNHYSQGQKMHMVGLSSPFIRNWSGICVPGRSMCVANCFDIVQDHFYMTLQLLRKPQPQEVVPKWIPRMKKGLQNRKCTCFYIHWSYTERITLAINITRNYSVQPRYSIQCSSSKRIYKYDLYSTFANCHHWSASSNMIDWYSVLCTMWPTRICTVCHKSLNMISTIHL